MAHVKQLTAFANLVPQHHLNETKSQGKRLPRINTKDPPFIAVNNPLEANEATPIIAIRLWSANAYVNRRLALCARSHQLQTQVGNGFQNDIPRQAAERLRPPAGAAPAALNSEKPEWRPRLGATRKCKGVRLIWKYKGVALANQPDPFAFFLCIFAFPNNGRRH
jgi:hypothetical protein